MNKEPDEFGLYHSLEHLEKIKYEIAFMPIEKQSRYADYVCITNLDNPHINEMVLSGISTEGLYEWNATSVGNAAFIALNSKDSNIRKFCLELLDIYKKFVSVTRKTPNSPKHIPDIDPFTKKALEELIKTFNSKVNKFKKEKIGDGS